MAVRKARGDLWVTVQSMNNIDATVRGMADEDRRMLQPWGLPNDGILELGAVLRRVWDRHGGFESLRVLFEIFELKFAEHAAAVRVCIADSSVTLPRVYERVTSVLARLEKLQSEVNLHYITQAGALGDGAKVAVTKYSKERLLA